MSPHTEALEKSRVSVIFFLKSIFIDRDTPFGICWTRIIDRDIVENLLDLIYNYIYNLIEG